MFFSLSSTFCFFSHLELLSPFGPRYMPIFPRNFPEETRMDDTHGCQLIYQLGAIIAKLSVNITTFPLHQWSVPPFSWKKTVDLENRVWWYDPVKFDVPAHCSQQSSNNLLYVTIYVRFVYFVKVCNLIQLLQLLWPNFWKLWKTKRRKNPLKRRKNPLKRRKKKGKFHTTPGTCFFQRK